MVLPAPSGPMSPQIEPAGTASDSPRTAGTAAFVIDGVLPAPAGYRWTMNHVLPVDDPMELFALNEMVIRDGEVG